MLVPSQAVIATVGIGKIKKQKTEENVNGAFPGYCYVAIPTPVLSCGDIYCSLANFLVETQSF